MSRIRTIKPDFWQSTKVARVPRETRLVFVGLWNEADDEGRLLGSPKRLAGALFPNDDDVDATKVTTWLDQLEAARLIQRYEVAGVAYVAIPGFGEHQKIDKRWASRLPPPPVLAEQLASPPEQPASPAQDPAPEMSSCSEMNSLSESGSGNAAAPSAPTAPSPPSAAPIASLSDRGGTWVRVQAGRQGGWQAGKPFTIDELLAEPLGEKLSREHACLDGKNGRPSLRTVLEDLWEPYSRWVWPTPAASKVELIVARHARTHRAAWEREHGIGVRPMPGEHITQPAGPTTEDRKRDAIAQQRAFRDKLTTAARALNKPAPPPFDAPDTEYRAWMRDNRDVMDHARGAT